MFTIHITWTGYHFFLLKYHDWPNSLQIIFTDRILFSTRKSQKYKVYSNDITSCFCQGKQNANETDKISASKCLKLTMYKWAENWINKYPIKIQFTQANLQCTVVNRDIVVQGYWFYIHQMFPCDNVKLGWHSLPGNPYSINLSKEIQVLFFLSLFRCKNQ